MSDSWDEALAKLGPEVQRAAWEFSETWLPPTVDRAGHCDRCGARVGLHKDELHIEWHRNLAKAMWLSAQAMVLLRNQIVAVATTTADGIEALAEHHHG